MKKMKKVSTILALAMAIVVVFSIKIYALDTSGSITCPTNQTSVAKYKYDGPGSYKHYVIASRNYRSGKTS